MLSRRRFLQLLAAAGAAPVLPLPWLVARSAAPAVAPCDIDVGGLAFPLAFPIAFVALCGPADTPEPTWTPTATLTPSPTQTPEPSATPAPTATPRPLWRRLRFPIARR